MGPTVARIRDIATRADVEPVARARRWLIYSAAAAGVANLAVLITQARALVHQLYTNADNASALVLPALAAHAPASAIVNIGNHPWYEPWWFMRATAALPAYRQIWEAAPFAFVLLGVASVAACAAWALGRMAGVLTAVVLLSASDALRGVLYTPEARVASVLHVGVLCGALLFVYEMAVSGRLTRRRLIAVGAPLVAFSGAGFTDQLVIAMGLVPFVSAPLFCWFRSKSDEWRYVSVFAIATGASSLGLALALNHVMVYSQHVVHAPFPITFASSTALISGLQNLIAEFVSLGGGNFFGTAVSGTNLLVFATGILTLAALLGTLRSIWRWAVPHAKDAAPPCHDTEARELFIAYWSIMLVVILLAFAGTSVAETAGDGRYLIGGWVAVAALLGAFASTSVMRTVVPLGVCLFALLTLRTHVVDGVPAYATAPNRPTAYAIEHFVEASDARIGYSGYWDSAPVTWETELHTRVFPIGPCGSSPSGWCPFGANMISTWYTPRAHTRTFLITDNQPNDPIEVAAPPSAFGHPLAEQVFGPFTVYIYDHDLASNLGP